VTASFTTDQMRNFRESDVSATAHDPSCQNFRNGAVEEFLTHAG
jgi:hypothetical protein